MRYINKTGNEPQMLIDWKGRLSEKLTQMESDPNKTGDDLWKLMNDDRTEIDKTRLKEHLVKKQGYLCCYCGAKVFPDHNSHVEHLHPKNLHKYLTYDYDNLLVSCMGGSKSVIHVVKAGESMESIAMQYGVDKEFLEMVYVDQAFIDKVKYDYDLEALKPDDRVVIFPKDTARIHCGHKKDSNEIGITPLQSDVEDHFRYDPQTGEIRITEANAHTVHTLGLNGNKLLNRNRAKILEKGIHAFQLIQNNAPTRGEDPSIFIKKLIRDYVAIISSKDEQGYFRTWYFVEASLFWGS